MIEVDLVSSWCNYNISRELTVSILRAIAADGKVIAASGGGKLKTQPNDSNTTFTFRSSVWSTYYYR